MTPTFTAIMMVTLFALGSTMIVGGGIGFMQSQPVLIESRSRLAQELIFAAAAVMFVAGIGVHFTGSSNTAFLKGQLAQTSLCELESESTNPAARGKFPDVIGAQIIACMKKSGFNHVTDPALCREAPVATNGFCYEPAAWVDRAITRFQLAFN